DILSESWGQSAANPQDPPAVVGAQVTIHVYHVSISSAVQKVNKMLARLRTGAFHVAVEVYGKEWSFGYTEDGSTGVWCCQPKQCDAHTYLRSLPMGRSRLSQTEVLALIGRLSREWQGEDYDLLRCN
ncbi:unnamed protein product, partial [Polarella glacialis]